MAFVFAIFHVAAAIISAVSMAITFADTLTLSPSGVTVPVTMASTPDIFPNFSTAFGSRNHEAESFPEGL